MPTTPNGISARILNLPEYLREKMVALREERGIRNQDVIEFQIAETLPKVVNLLIAAGIEHHSETRPFRALLSDDVLAKVRYASAQTGVPAVSLIVACLSQEIGGPQTPKAEPAAAKEPAAKPARKTTKTTKKPAPKASSGTKPAAKPKARKPRTTKKKATKKA